MKSLAVVTNASYQSDSVREQVSRFREECTLRGIDFMHKSIDTAWDASAASYFPPQCIYLDKDIYFASVLEKRGVRLYNSARSIALADDKLKTQIALNGLIDFPKTLFSPKRYCGTTPDKEICDCARALGFPMVVKEACGSLGKQVYLAKDIEELRVIAEKIGSLPHLYQEAIRPFGRSIRLYVVGGRVIGSVRYCNDGDFRSNMADGGRAEPFAASERHCAAAIAAAEALGLDFCAADFFDAKEPLMIEVNSNAYFKGLEQAGVNIAGAIIDYIAERGES
jgi:ribosomal protein S6--L-glutamate ligase/gamma-F420-2:alpha-L-glutamate ligase